MAKQIFNAKKLVHRFGGPTHLQRRLARTGRDISVKGINMWVTRNSVPSTWLPELARLARQDGFTLNLADFWEEEGTGGDLGFLE